MTRSATFDWGPCPCGGGYEHNLVEVRMTVEGKDVLLKDVPQGRCPVCGSRVYKAETLARVEGTMQNDQVDRRLNRAMV